jgi:hypothetical protein
MLLARVRAQNCRWVLLLVRLLTPRSVRNAGNRI